MSRTYCFSAQDALYLGEIEFRWNRRGPFINRLFTLFGTNHGPLPLKALFA